jgi:hypothetical protein
VDTLERFWTDLVGRLSGPMTFRLILQPIMAAVIALKDGLEDAHKGRPPYFWAMASRPEVRRTEMQELWTSVGRVIVLGVLMDAVYQLIVMRWIYPVETIVVVLLLVVIPYMLFRSVVNRIARHRTGSGRIRS